MGLNQLEHKTSTKIWMKALSSISSNTWRAREKTLSSRHGLGMVRPNTRLISHQEANHNPNQYKLTTKHQQNTKTQIQT